MLQTRIPLQLQNVFNDPNYAWKLLQAQISIQMQPIVQGQIIAKLLQLYMKGVEKMNSISDERQSYFKNKVTSLMTKQTVIKSLKQNPMKKKAKHQQVTCKQQIKKQKNIKKQIIQITKDSQIKPISHLELKQKQKEFQMRIAYTAQQNNPDNLKKFLLQQEYRQENITKKIKNIINDHEERLKQRIKQRKLRTATYRTQSQFNQQSQTQPSTNNFNSNRKQQSYFQPILINKTKLLNGKQENQRNIKQQNKRKFNSVEVKRNLMDIDSPTKRKNSIDFQKEKYVILNF